MPESTIAPRGTVLVPAPASGAELTVTSEAGGTLTFAFDPALATALRPEGTNDLVFEPDGGGRVVIGGFFEVADNTLPDLSLPDGTLVAASDFFQNSGLDLSTAAGPGGAPLSGGTNYDDAAGDLLAGLDRYDSLDTDYWGRDTEDTDLFAGLTAGGAEDGIDGPSTDPGPGLGPDPDEEPEIHAHDNIGVIERGDPIEHMPDPVEGGETHNPDGGYDDIVGRWHPENVFEDGNKLDDKVTGLTTKGGATKIEEKFNEYWPEGYDFSDAVQEFMPGWESSGANAAGIVQEVSMGADGTISVPYSMYSTNNNPSGADGCYFVLFRVTEDGEYVQTEYSYYKIFDQGSSKGIHDTIVWEGVPEGDYVVMAFVVEGDGNSGQKPVLDFETETSWTEQPDPTYTYDYQVEGNVIGDYLDAAGSEGEDREGSDHDNHRDHASDGYALSVTEFSVNGVQGVLGEPFEGLLADGTPYTFIMYADGSYKLLINGVEDPDYKLADLDVEYKLQGYNPDGDPQYIYDDADLYLRSEHHALDDADAGQGLVSGTDGNDVIYMEDDICYEIHAGEGNDVIFAGSGGALIYGGAGSDTMHSGEGNDTFAWADADMDGSTDYISGFVLAQDILRFEDLFETDQPDQELLAELLSKGDIAVTATEDGLALTLSSDTETVTIDITFADGHEQIPVYETPADNAALLAQLLGLTTA